MLRSAGLPIAARFARSACGAGLLAVAAVMTGCQSSPDARNPADAATEAGAADGALAAVSAAPPTMLGPGEGVELFDGSTLGAWQPEPTGRDDAVRVADGAIELSWGSPGTSMAWTGTRIPPSYELSLEVAKLEGAGSGYWFLTFPIDAERTCTLTLAHRMAWLCGESGPAGAGATSRSFGLETREWHSVRLRVVPGRVEAQVDDERLTVEPTGTPAVALAGIDAPRELEIATWSMTAAVRELRLERLPDGAR